MTRPATEVDLVSVLIEAGANDSEISRRTGIPRSTVRDWRALHRNPGLRVQRSSGCPICEQLPLDPAWYAYLLGLYLGDGCLSEHPKQVYALRIVLDQRYPLLIQECAKAIQQVRGTETKGPYLIQREGCFEVCALWKHWICLFPQHGRGVKHLRPIHLAPWQEEIAHSEPARLLRGLIHSDGCRVMNRIKKAGVTYAYPRYQFVNSSADIRQIFCAACDDFGVRWAQSRWNAISVSRRADVEKLDQVIGPKT